MTAGSQLICGADKAILASQINTGFCSRQRLWDLGFLPRGTSGGSHVISIQQVTHPQKPKDDPAPEDQRTRSFHIRTLDTSYLVKERKKEESEREGTRIRS